MTGIVERFNHTRGFGFIRPLMGNAVPNETPLLFFHISVVKGRTAPPIGAEVRFDVCRGNKGPQACTVELMVSRKPGNTLQAFAGSKP